MYIFNFLKDIKKKYKSIKSGMWISLHSTTREGFDGKVKGKQEHLSLNKKPIKRWIESPLGKVILSTLFCLLINVVFLLQVSIKDVLLRNN